MKYQNIFFATIVSIVLFICCISYNETSYATDKPQTVDLIDLIDFYLIPASSEQNLQAWYRGAELDSPFWIEWKTDGIDNDRIGEVIVTISGKPIHILRRRWEPNPWLITLSGSRAGVDKIGINSQINSQELDNFNLETEMKKRNVTFKLYRCDPQGFVSGGERIYSITFPEKKLAWLYHAWSCGSGGCSADLKIFLSKTDADDLPGMTTSCRVKK
jgi:hypothetical protein